MAVTQSITAVSDVAARILDRLAEQFTEADNNFQKLLDVYASEIQELEAVFTQILNNAHLDPGDTNVVGEQLDGIGQVVGLSRGGLPDSTYRARLRARILTIKSTATPEEIIAIAEAFLADTSTVTYESEDNTIEAGFEIIVDDPIATGVGVQLGVTIGEAKAGGVNGYAIYQESADSATFAFDGANSATFDSGGFGFRGAAG